MLVNRRTFNLRSGAEAEMTALMKEGLKWKPAGVPARYYFTEIGPFDVAAMEAEFESLADYERLVAEWVGKAPPDYWERWDKVVLEGGTNEIWRLADLT
jgi:hypothetical protein